jgi:hypothetical protein
LASGRGERAFAHFADDLLKCLDDSDFFQDDLEVIFCMAAWCRKASPDLPVPWPLPGKPDR